MSEKRIENTLALTEGYVQTINTLTGGVVSDIDEAIHQDLTRYHQEISLRVGVIEVRITEIIVITYHNAEYHLLKAYFHASPAIWALLAAIWAVVIVIIEVIQIINSLLLVITGENLIYWVDKLIPGFQDVWNRMMNNISKFSKALGWGVDGIGHLLNVTDAGTDMWATITGKTPDTAKVAKIDKLQALMSTFSTDLTKWENNPGAMMALFFEKRSTNNLVLGVAAMTKMTDKISDLGEKATAIFTSVGTITDELLAIQNDMPEAVAENIPQAIWDGLERADTAINDRLLPRLDQLQEKMDSISTLLDKYRDDASEIAARLSRPGDLLAEIDKLPDYVRTEQLIKIDSVTSALLREKNEADFEVIQSDLKAFGLVAEALRQSPPPLSFMLLELPGASPGIVAEPRETWFVGDY